jgi:hypothetical protein
MKELKEIQISHLEVKIKENGERKAWTRQEWLVWLSSAQYKQLQIDFRHDGNLCLLFPLERCPKHQDGQTRNPVTALPVTSNYVKTKPDGYVDRLSWTRIRSGLKRMALGIL